MTPPPDKTPQEVLWIWNFGGPQGGGGHRGFDWSHMVKVVLYSPSPAQLLVPVTVADIVLPCLAPSQAHEASVASLLHFPNPELLNPTSHL